MATTTIRDDPPVSQTKIRIKHYIDDVVTGPENAALRKLARSAIEFSPRVKHSSTSTRRELASPSTA